MDQTQDNSFMSLSNDRGGNMQTGGYVGGSNNVGVNGQGGAFSPIPISTDGPIVLNNYGKKSKKWLAVFIVVLLFIAVAVGVFAVIQSSSRSSSIDALASILEEGRDEVVKAEAFFDNLNNGEVSFGMLFQNNNSEVSGENSMETLIVFLREFKEQLGTINQSGFDKRIKEPLLELESVLEQRLSLYEEIEGVCMTFYETYNSPNGISLVNELKSSPNRSIADLAQDFYSYYEKKAQIMSDMEKNNCEVEEFSDVCEEKYDEFDQNEEFMKDGSMLSGLMKEITAQNGYEDGFVMSNLIDELLYIIEGAKNE